MWHKGGELVKVYEIKLKLYVMKDILYDNVLICVTNLIDKCFSHSHILLNFHNENRFKNYVYNGLFPMEASKVYKAGNLYTVIIRTVDEVLLAHLEKFLVNEYTEFLKALTMEKRIIHKKHIETIYSITPAVAKFSKGYWRTNETMEVFEKRIKDNLIKKYNTYFNIKIEEDFELFTFIKFENHKPIATNYKNIRILGDKLTLNVAENNLAQDLAYFALGSGILEMNSRGFGFVNYRWL